MNRPIHVACWKGDVATVRTHLENGIDVNIRSLQGGWMPLHFATLWGRVDVVKLLLEYNADCDIETEQGYKPLDILSIDLSDMEGVPININGYNEIRDLLNPQ